MNDLMLSKLFCIKNCTEWILLHKFSKVGLEFSNDPQSAVKVSQLLRKEIGFSPIVLEDSNRACGNCCVDERTAKPRGIEAIIHFGRTCLTPTLALPVLHVLTPDIIIDPESVTNMLLSEERLYKNDDLILVYDVLCLPSIDATFVHLKKHFPNLILSSFIIPERSKVTYHNTNFIDDFLKIDINDQAKSNLFTFNYRQVNLPQNKSINDYNFVYIGKNGSTLIALQMRFSEKTFFNVDPVDHKIIVSNFVKEVMSRSRKIEQVKEAKTIGLISTLAYGEQEILQRLKKLIKSSKRRHYSFFMGKINEAKLANIVGVDVFVYIGCPESSLFDRNENTYLYKNIVTPWELEVAINPSFDWSLNFETNFKEFLNVDKYEQEFVMQEDEDIPEVDSLREWKERNSAIVERNPGTLFKLHENGAGAAFVGLCWQGLNPKEESSVPLGTVVEGRKGIAMEYDTDRRN